MNLTEELARLNELKQSGALSEEEFAAAKAKLIAEGNASTAAPTAKGPMSETAVNQWCMFMHLSALAGFVIPFAGLAAPIVMWQLKKDESEIINTQGKIITNWIITMVIASVVCMITVIGFPLVFAIVVISVVFSVMGGIKANNGVTWPYPLSFKFIK